MPHSTDLDLIAKDVSELATPDAITALLTKLGYDTADRTLLSPEAVGLAGESASAIKRIEVRYVQEQPLSPKEEHASGERIHQALDHPFRLTFTRQDAIARQLNGKYETFYADIPGTTGSPGVTPI